MNKKELYTIGKLSEMSNVSVEQLRYLDKIGILHPEKRHMDTGYRYYSDKQLEELIYTDYLRELGFEFDDISDLLGEYSIDNLIDKTKKSVERSKRELINATLRFEKNTEYLNQMILGSSILEIHKEKKLNDSKMDVKIMEIEAKYAFSKRSKHLGSANELFLDRYTKMRKKAASLGINTTSEMIAIMHTGFDSQFHEEYGDLETCLIIEGYEKFPSDKIKKIPMYKGIVSYHIGSYKNMYPTYRHMKKWAEDNKVETTNISIENYIVSPFMVPNEEDFVTQLILPLKEYENIF